MCVRFFHAGTFLHSLAFLSYIVRQNMPSLIRTDLTTYDQPTTTTVFVNPTVVTEPTQLPKVSVPVAAIVGGALAGILLAVMASVGWVYWGKSIKRKTMKRHTEAVRLKPLVFRFRTTYVRLC